MEALAQLHAIAALPPETQNPVTNKHEVMCASELDSRDKPLDSVGDRTTVPPSSRP
jgi:hypothetical protein